MYNLRIKSPAELISRIEWEFSPRSAISLDESDVEMAFAIRFTRYLRGYGHPAHDTIKDLVSPDDMEAVRGSVTFRSEQFLRHVSETQLLPSDPDQKIYVCVLFRISSPVHW